MLLGNCIRGHTENALNNVCSNHLAEDLLCKSHLGKSGKVAQCILVQNLWSPALKRLHEGPNNARAGSRCGATGRSSSHFLAPQLRTRGSLTGFLPYKILISSYHDAAALELWGNWWIAPRIDMRVGTVARVSINQRVPDK